MDNKTFISTLTQRLNTNREECGEMIASLSQVIAEAALEGDTVTFPGFGNFEPRKRDERVAAHPATGKLMLFPPKLTLTFRPSTLLKQKVRRHE